MPRIMRCYQNSSRKPSVTVTDNAFKIVLPNLNFADTSDTVIGSREEQIMQFVSEHGSITRKEVEKLLGISQASAARIVRKLTEESI